MKWLPALLLPFLGFAQMQVSQGTLHTFKDFKSDFVGAHDLYVWLPDSYDAKETYEVLYLQDGQSLFDANTTWNKQEWQVDETASRLITAKQVQPFIVVGIQSKQQSRHAELFPQKPFESLAQKTQDSLYALQSGTQPLLDGKVRSDAFLKFVVKEIMPFMAHTYAVKQGKEHTFIGGSSMGGLLALYAICEYPDIFGGAMCLSTHWIGTFEAAKNPIPNAFLNYLKRHLPSHLTHKIYFDYGDQTLDALYEPFQKQADLILMAKGYGPENWRTKKFPGADHSEKAWAARLEVPLLFLLGS